MINSGCIIQIDAGSILGYFGKNCKIASETMIRRRMVHIIGSDSHDTGKRNFCLKEAMEIVKTKMDSSLLDAMLDNPNKIISGKKIIPYFSKGFDGFDINQPEDIFILKYLIKKKIVKLKRF